MNGPITRTGDGLVPENIQSGDEIVTGNRSEIDRQVDVLDRGTGIDGSDSFNSVERVDPSVTGENLVLGGTSHLDAAFTTSTGLQTTVKVDANVQTGVVDSGSTISGTGTTTGTTGTTGTTSVSTDTPVDKVETPKVVPFRAALDSDTAGRVKRVQNFYHSHGESISGWGKFIDWLMGWFPALGHLLDAPGAHRGGNYSVRPGDTLASIAHAILPKLDPDEAVQVLMEINGFNAIVELWDIGPTDPLPQNMSLLIPGDETIAFYHEAQAAFMDGRDIVGNDGRNLSDMYWDSFGFNDDQNGDLLGADGEAQLTEVLSSGSEDDILALDTRTEVGLIETERHTNQRKAEGKLQAADVNASARSHALHRLERLAESSHSEKARTKAKYLMHFLSQQSLTSNYLAGKGEQVDARSVIGGGITA
jgi:hypothetical protein